jgi:hypothetical protein
MIQLWYLKEKNTAYDLHGKWTRLLICHEKNTFNPPFFFLLSSIHLECMLMADFSIETFKFVFQSFKKSRNKILEVANDEYYKHAKSQYEILCILGYI